MTDRPRRVRTQRPEAGLHRRRGRGQGVPGLDRSAVTTTTRRPSGKQRLRGRHRRGPARPAALPHPGLAVRVRRRPRRLPAGLDRAEGWGRTGPSRSASPARAARATTGPPRLARVPRPQRGVGTHPLPLQRQRRAAAQPEHLANAKAAEGVRRSGTANWVRVRRAQRRRLDARRPRARAVPVRQRAADGPRRTCTTTRCRSNACTGSGSPRTWRCTTSTLTEEIDGLRRRRAHARRGTSDPAWQGMRENAEQLTGDRRLVRGHLRRQRGVRAAGRRAVPQRLRCMQAAPRRATSSPRRSSAPSEDDFAERDLRYTTRDVPDC